MAPKRASSSPIPIGNCKVTIEAQNFTCQSEPNNLQISISRNAKVKVSVNEDALKNFKDGSSNINPEDREDGCFFVLVNPKETDSASRFYLQEVLQMYIRELPGMSYAANTGKKSTFLERCVTKGKYCTLLLKFKSMGGPGKVIAAITYQIVPADTHHAEIPLMAVSSIYQRKGLGHLLYEELRKRLQRIGIRTIFCWGDKESEGFWLKQGFVSVAEVDTKGRARRLPIKADIRRALCFPGGSTLMVSHLSRDILAVASSTKCLSLKLNQNSFLATFAGNNGWLACSDSCNNTVKCLPGTTETLEICQPEASLKNISRDDNLNGAYFEMLAVDEEVVDDGKDANLKHFSHSSQGGKRVWEASLSSLKSKKVKGSCQIDCHSNSSWGLIPDADRIESCFLECSSGTSGKRKQIPDDFLTNEQNAFEQCKGVELASGASVEESPSKKQTYRVMLMNIADDTKKIHLTKVIEDLGGFVTSDGSKATHVVTGKVRRTSNFCSALCSGAWVVSPSWLKESFREGRFLDETSFILNDEEYLLTYKSDLKDSVLRAKANPRALLKGYNVCIGDHVQPPAKTLSAIVKSAGGNVICGLDKLSEATKTIFVACEEDMEEARVASRKGIWTFSSDWFMNCIMRQELDLEAPQFAESL